MKERVFLIKNKNVHNYFYEHDQINDFDLFFKCNLEIGSVSLVKVEHNTDKETLIANFDSKKDKSRERFQEKLFVNTSDYRKPDLNTKTIFEYCAFGRDTGISLEKVDDVYNNNKVSGYAAYLNYYDNITLPFLNRPYHLTPRCERVSLFEVINGKVSDTEHNITANQNGIEKPVDVVKPGLVPNININPNQDSYM